MQKSNQFQWYAYLKITQKPIEVKEHCRMKTNPLNDSLMRISKSKLCTLHFANFDGFDNEVQLV